MRISVAALFTLSAAVSASPLVCKGRCREKGLEFPYEFTSIYHISATPDQVVNATGVPTPGEPGANGSFNFGIDAKENVICYSIILCGVTGEYQSPALTATHIHAATKGKAGPPRLAFPNPVGDDKVRKSTGCLKGPFVTGIKDAAGVDTGTGFHVSQIEKNSAGFFCDTHTRKYVAGAVRGQLG